jgi:hypothetical protein
MYKLPLVCAYVASVFLLVGTAYAADDSTVAVVRDRYGGSLEYDTQYDRPERALRGPYGDRSGGRYGDYQSRYADRLAPTPSGPIPQYYPPGGAPYYGGSYYPPNADIDPDQTRFDMLYEHNVRTLGE